VFASTAPPWLNQLRTTCQCCTRRIDARRDQPRCCAAGQCCLKLLSPLTLTYIHSVLKSALEHAVREEEIPRNVARNVRTGTPRPRRFEPLTAAQDHRLHALFELALHTGLRKGELLGLRWDLDLDARTAAIRRTLAANRRRRAHHAAHQDADVRAPHRSPPAAPSR
jgi:integrase